MLILLALDPTALAADKEAEPPAAEAPKKEKKDKVPVKMSGLLYAHAGLDLTEGAELATAFDLDRAYLRADAKIDDHWSTRLTVDAGREKVAEVEIPGATTGAAATVLTVPEDERLRLFVKHAWLEYSAGDVRTRAGIVDTTYVPYTEAFLGTRWQARMAMDEVKWQSTADLGVAVSGDHADSTVLWSAGVFNGEGFSAPEVNGGKAFQGRVTVDPLAKGDLSLPISAFVEEELHGADTDGTLQWAASLGFKEDHIAALAEYATATTGTLTGSIVSVSAVPRIPDVVGLMVRLDRFDLDASSDGDEWMRLHGALFRDFADKLSLGLSYERLMFVEAGAVDEHGLFVRMQAGF